MSAAYGPKPELTWLPVARLTVDMRYQRSLESLRSQKLIERMAAEFRWQRFGAVLAAPLAMGNYALIDGQHRVEVLKRLGIAEAPAILLESISVAEQAAAFIAANRDRVTVNPFAIHHAEVQSGAAQAVAIDAMCRAAGIEIPRYPIPVKNLQPNQTLALGALRRLATVPAQAEIGARVLKILRRAFPEDAAALRAHVISGVAAFLETHAGVDDAALGTALAHAGLRRLETVVFAYGGGTARALAVSGFLSELLPQMRMRPLSAPRAEADDPLVAIRQRLTEEEAAKPKVRAQPAPPPKPQPRPGRDVTATLMGDPSPGRPRA